MTIAAAMKKQRISSSIWSAFLARSGVVAYVPIIVIAFTPIIVVGILMLGGAIWIFPPTTDAAHYQCYALIFWLGSRAIELLPPTQCTFLPASTSIQPPFHMLPLEYPPLTLLLFSLALFAPISFYQLAFSLCMALTAVAVYTLLLWYGPRGAALTFLFYALLGEWATIEGGFDIVPATLTLLCIITAERKHWTSAYVALAIGTLLKIYPLLLFPALFIAEQRDIQRFHTPSQSLTLKTTPIELWQTLRGIPDWRWKNSMIFLAILLGATGLFASLDFYGAL